MATKYVFVSTQWEPGTFPNKELSNVIRARVKTLVDSGLAVSGLLPLSSEKPGGDKLSLTQHTQQTTEYAGQQLDNDFIKYGTNASNVIHEFNEATKTVTSRFPEGQPILNIRILVNADVAAEYIDFMLTLGAINSFILTEEEVSAKFDIPPDSVIDQYVTKV